MIINVIYFLIACILIFIIYIGGKGLNRGINAKAALKKEKTKDHNKTNILNELEKLNDLRIKKIISEGEFEKAKKKLLD